MWDNNGPETVTKWRSDGKWRGDQSGRCYEDHEIQERGGQNWASGLGKPSFDFGEKK